jgi:hypothetical protein
MLISNPCEDFQFRISLRNISTSSIESAMRRISSANAFILFCSTPLARI